VSRLWQAGQHPDLKLNAAGGALGTSGWADVCVRQMRLPCLTPPPLTSHIHPLSPTDDSDIAERINHLYGGKGWKKRGGRGGRVLKVPEPFIPPAGARIMSLQVGGRGWGGPTGGEVLPGTSLSQACSAACLTTHYRTTAPTHNSPPPPPPPITTQP